MVLKDTKEITTIKLKKRTKERIEKLRVYPRESYDEIMQRLLNILNVARVSPARVRAKLGAIERERKKIKKEN